MTRNLDGPQTAAEWEMSRKRLNHDADTTTGHTPYIPAPGSEFAHTLNVIKQTHESHPNYCKKCGYHRNDFNGAHDAEGNCKYQPLRYDNEKNQPVI